VGSISSYQHQANLLIDDFARELKRRAAATANLLRAYCARSQATGAWRRALWSDEAIVLEKIASSTLLKKTHMLR
jgi:hypothetical protein